MPRLNADGRGDLLVQINATLPAALSDRERRLYEELRELRSGA
jgi:DnaJ-class molecular chaperone